MEVIILTALIMLAYSFRGCKDKSIATKEYYDESGYF